MTAKQIFDYLLDHANKRWDTTCDGLIAGDGGREVTCAATCFKLTAEVLDRAIDMGVDMIVTHEPTFSMGDTREKIVFETDRKKLSRLEGSGIVLYRFHDHAHDTEPDYIHAGFIEELGLDIAHRYQNESLGICRYELREPLMLSELKLRIAERLGIAPIRCVGKREMTVKTVCLGLGSVGVRHLHVLEEPGCDLFITGETSEVLACEYVRDACYYGSDKAVLLLGHCGAEYAGMRLLAKRMSEELIPTDYLHCGEVFF